MMGGILVGASLGILQGMSTRSQGKNIIRSGKRIEEEYKKLGSSKALFEKSMKKQKDVAGKIKGYQEGSAKVQYERNQSELKRALESNLRGVMYNYVAQKDNLKEQMLDAKSKLLTGSYNPNVEKSSIKHDSFATLDKEVSENQRTINENQIGAIEQVTSESLGQTYRVGQDYDNSISNIQRNYNATLSGAESQYNQDINNINSQISTGVSVGRNMQQQGYTLKAQGSSQITGALVEAGLQGFSAMGGFSGIKNKLGGLSSSGSGNFATSFEMTKGTADLYGFEKSFKSFGQLNPFGRRGRV